LFLNFQVKRIARHRHVPKHILNSKNELKVMKDSKKRKEANRRKHSKPGAVPYVGERETHIVKEVD
jgi:WD repeat and SOF domain-containing protein 1